MPAEIAPTLPYNVCDGLLTGLAGLPWKLQKHVHVKCRQRGATGAQSVLKRLEPGCGGGGSRRNGVTAERGQLEGESAGKDRRQVK